MKPSLFGTDGIRGPVGGSLINPESMLKLGWALGSLLYETQPAQRVLIGKDTRISGYMLESALQAGLTAAGMNIGLLGPMPTPAVAYLTQTLRAAAGIVISASHNPFEDNGIKIFNAQGSKLDDDFEHAVSNRYYDPMEVVTSDSIGRARHFLNAPARYIERCKSRFNGPPQALSNLHIVLDCAEGATYLIAPCVFEELGATVTVRHATPDGFNINQHCGALYPQQLAQTVLSEQADCGIAFDGDGDRVIMVDHTGQVCDGDYLLYVIAQHLHRQGSLTGGIVGTHMSNGALEYAFERMNIPFERVDVGDRHVMAKLKENGWHLGAEPSGHLIDLNQTLSGDGIIAALQVLSAMVTQQSSLHALVSTLHKLPQALINLKRSPDHVWPPSEQLDAIKAQALQQLGDQGRILIRPSGTEPLVRVFVEGTDPVMVEHVAQQLSNELQTLLG
ncbi:MAG: phosphoglucosamine mutase [Legionellales bacterium]|nr:phosphoglucosamine mutase [Legionellales bacterium]|tara:strand:+ start:2281 stop:3624 length:1344 start_codon:yes stop_codon:yes gene_type:complete